MHIEEAIKLDFKDVLIRPKRSTISSRSQVQLNREFKPRWSNKPISCVPIICANMDSVASFSMAKSLYRHQIMTALDKHYTLEQLYSFFSTPESKLSFFSIGIGAEDETKLKAFMQHPSSTNAVGICIDVANGYTQRFVDFIRKVRGMYPNMLIMAGNVVTGDMTEEIILSGADICKVGVGPGSACLTRQQAGVGYPQLSAIIECADAAHGLGGMVCGDGGITCGGDLAKAFGGGADFAMIGGMFAAHEECDGEIIEKDGKKFMSYYGMSSSKAQEKHGTGVADYKASEGRVTELPLRGSIDGTVKVLLGGLRSCCTYVGAKQLKELSKRTTFIRVTQQLNPIFSSQTTGI